MTNTTPTNLGRLVVRHSIKLLYSRTHTELEHEINKRLTSKTGQYEVKDIRIQMLAEGAFISVIHYFEHVRKQDVPDVQAAAKTKKLTAEHGAVTKHVAPAKNTPLSHNTKQQKPNIQPDLNTINNELDKLKAEPTPQQSISDEELELEKLSAIVKPDTRAALEEEPTTEEELTTEEDELTTEEEPVIMNAKDLTKTKTKDE